MNTFNVYFKSIGVRRGGNPNEICYDVMLYINQTSKKFCISHNPKEYHVMNDILYYSKQCNKNRSNDIMFLKVISRLLFLKYDKHFCNQKNYIHHPYSYNMLKFFPSIDLKSRQNIIHKSISGGICPICNSHIDMKKLFNEFINHPEFFNNSDTDDNTDEDNFYLLSPEYYFQNGFYKNNILTYISPITNKSYSFMVTNDSGLYIMNGIYKILKVDRNIMSHLCESKDEYDFAHNLTIIYENNYCGKCDSILMDGVHCHECGGVRKKITSLHKDYLIDSILQRDV